MADERSEIMAWLSPLESQIRYHDIQTRRVDKVGDWLMQTKRNIRIGPVVSVGVMLTDQPCFSMEVPELEKHILGEREDS